MNKILKTILKPLFPIIGLGYSKCHICGAPWNLVDGHAVMIDEGRGCFAICEDCWKEKSDYEIVQAYMKLYDEWENGDEYNRPLTVEQIGFTREALREAVLNALRERK